MRKLFMVLALFCFSQFLFAQVSYVFDPGVCDKDMEEFPMSYDDARRGISGTPSWFTVPARAFNVARDVDPTRLHNEAEWEAYFKGARPVPSFYGVYYYTHERELYVYSWWVTVPKTGFEPMKSSGFNDWALHLGIGKVPEFSRSEKPVGWGEFPHIPQKGHWTCIVIVYVWQDSGDFHAQIAVRDGDDGEDFYGAYSLRNNFRGTAGYALEGKFTNNR